MNRHIAKIVHLGSSNDQCYIQNRVVMNRVVINHVIKRSRPRGYKTLFMLNSAETKIYPAHKC